MRVLMLSWEYPPYVVGGLGKHVSELVPALARRGMHIDLATPMLGGGEAIESEEGIRVHRIPASLEECPDFYAKAWQINRFLESACEGIIAQHGPFDLMHNHDWLSSFAARALAYKYGVPMVATIHATERGRGRGHLVSGQSRRIDDAERRLVHDARRVICCTHYMVDEVHRYFGIPSSKTDVIPNGVDPASFQELEGIDLSAFRSRYAEANEKIVLYVGRIVYEKGIEVLVRSVERVLASVPETKFVIAGKGPELEKLRHLVEKMELSDKVELTGFIDDASRDRLYKVADCAVFPSLYEPFGIVALEAMVARTPLVVSEIGGLREVVQHAETGITIYPNDPESCAWGIIHTLQHPEWARQRAENAYRKVLMVYNWDVIAEGTKAVYRRVAGACEQVSS